MVFSANIRLNRATLVGYAVYYVRIGSCGNNCRSPLPERLGGDRVKEDIQPKLTLLKHLNSNLNFLFENPNVKGQEIEQLIERLALIDQCIDQTLLLIILLEELAGHLHSVDFEKYLVQ
ncbi:MAG: hypothetical protein APF81_14970 [Desulfosporosinus sp. BRH_c37]|nr:MAG: hypothetical protein APF81_14970 [Desulfosporosinus sp. BRH_c37]